MDAAATLYALFPALAQTEVPLDLFLVGVAVILLVAFGPPILFAASVARAKRYRREPGHAIRSAFLWGALGAAGISLLLNTVISGEIVRPYLRHDGLTAVATAVIVAPLVEEAAKPLILWFGAVRRHSDEVVDGIIYGAVAGLGFSATENLLYEVSALATSGGAGYLFTAVARTFSSSLLHATATAITGYGIARYLTGRGSLFGILPFFLLAVLLHAGFNLIATSGLLWGFLALFVVAIVGFSKVRSRITELSMVAPSDVWHAVGRQHQVGDDAGLARSVPHVPPTYRHSAPTLAEPDGHWHPVGADATAAPPHRPPADPRHPDLAQPPRSDPSHPVGRPARGRTWQPIDE